MRHVANVFDGNNAPQRLEELQLQTAAAEALLAANPERAREWQATLTLLAAPAAFAAAEAPDQSPALACGLGFELVFLIPPLLHLRRREGA